MKHLWQLCSLLSLATLVACNDVESIGNKLDPAEITYVNNASYNKCVADSTADLNDLIAESNATLASYQEKVTSWTYKYNRNGTSDTGYILFWKNATPNYYFLVSLKRDGANSTRFYKITTTINADMFKDLQEKKCRKTANLSIGLSASSASVTIDEGTETDSTDSNLRLRYKETYSYKNNLPAIFAFLASKRTIETLNSSDTVTKTETYEYTITATSTTPTPPGDGSLSAYPAKDYRMIRYTPEVPSTTPASYSYPYFELSTDNFNGTIDADQDGTPDFSPSAEL